VTLETSVIASMDDFYRVQRSHWKSHFVYRGESSPAYSLLPKFGRAVLAGGFTTAGHETTLLRQFERQATPHVTGRPTDDWEWLAIAQHYGLATRLLDWTRNPLVGAYFACSGHGSDAVLYAFDSDELRPASFQESPFSIQTDVMFEPRHSTARITAQSGLFTVHANPQQVFSPITLQRHVIRRALIPELKVTVETYGVHAASLFPGLDSVAAQVNRKFGVF